MAEPGALGVGMVGYAFMGAAHAQAGAPPRRIRTAARGRGWRRSAAGPRRGGGAKRLGWQATETDWRALIRRDDVQLVNVCTPGDSHAPIAIAALRAGKHVLCEKPLATTVAEAEASGGRG